MITRLSFMDFDGTLFNTPLPEFGKEEWKQKTGEEYPHQGWWGRIESLSTNVFKIKPFPSVLNQLQDDTARRDTYTILLTNRIERLKPEVMKLLKQNNIVFDEYSFKNGDENKVERIKQFLKRFPNVNEIAIYDDRKKELDILSTLKNEIGDNITVNIYKADDGSLSLIESYNKIKDIINNVILEFNEENKNNRIYN